MWQFLLLPTPMKNQSEMTQVKARGTFSPNLVDSNKSNQARPMLPMNPTQQVTPKKVLKLDEGSISHRPKLVLQAPKSDAVTKADLAAPRMDYLEKTTYARHPQFPDKIVTVKSKTAPSTWHDAKITNFTREPKPTVIRQQLTTKSRYELNAPLVQKGIKARFAGPKKVEPEAEVVCVPDTRARMEAYSKTVSKIKIKASASSLVKAQWKQ